MAKKKPTSSRSNNWMKLKSVLWKEYKEEGLYDWNSDRFNKLVTATYDATGKKNPSKVARVGLIAKGIEESILTEAIAKSYQIAYYEIGKTLEAFRDDTTYTGYKVVTNFNTPEFRDEKFKVDDFEYESSQFQEMVRRVDAERSISPTASPPPKITVDVLPDKKRIDMYVSQAGEQDDTEEEEFIEEKAPKLKTKKPYKKKAYKEISATPATVKGLKEAKKENEERIKDLTQRLKTEKELIIPLIKASGSGFDDLILETTLNLKNWSRELRKLEKENEDIRKQLSKQGKGFVAKPRKVKKRKK